MVGSLSGFEIDPIPDFMQTPDFKTFIETVIPSLKVTEGTSVLSVDPSQGSIDAFDLTGFLLDNGIPYRVHYIVMRMNGLNSIHEFNEDTGDLLLPNWNVLDSLISVYKSKLFKT